MKQLTWKLILPLTIVSFAVFTKWWYALPDDAIDTVYIGFPFPFVGDGWHTSGSLQIFVLELFADISVYFLLWFIVVFCISRVLPKIKIHKIFVTGIWTICGLILICTVLIGSFQENIFYFKRPYKMEIMETGYMFHWQRIERPNYFKYHPEAK
jgi:hypothetical protein